MRAVFRYDAGNRRAYIGKTINATVTSTLQTSAGRMIFGRFDGVIA